MNTLVLTVTVLLTFALVAASAPTSASAQYLSDGPTRDETGAPIFDDNTKVHIPKYDSGIILSPIPLITFLIIGVVAGGIVLVFFIKGRSDRHATVDKV